MSLYPHRARSARSASLLRSFPLASLAVTLSLSILIELVQAGHARAQAITPIPAASRVLASWDQAFEQLRTRSVRYRIASSEVARARGRARVALADLLPRAEAQGSFTHELITTQENFGAGPVTVPAQDVFGASATLGVTLIDARAIHAYGTAERAIDAAASDFAAERRALVDALVEALLSAWTAERLAELHRVGLHAALDRLALTQTKRELGHGTTLDVDRAQQDVQTARSQTLQGDDALIRVRESLGLLLGTSIAIAAPAFGNTDGLERSVAALCTASDRVERDPAVVAAQRRLQLAERATDSLDLELLPRLDLQSQLRWDSQTVYGPDATFQLGAVLRVPIWDGGARYGRARDAQAQLTQARLRLTQARLEALSQTTQAARSIEIAAEAASIGSAQRELARRIDTGTRSAFEQGVGTILDLIASAQALRQAELQAVLLESVVVRARARAALSNAECAL